MSTGRLLNQFRISAAMRPYVLRLRLRGWHFDFESDPNAAEAFTAHIDEMRRILVKRPRRISGVAVDRAILKTIEAAVDFQLSELRYQSLKAMENQSQATLDRLIEVLRQLAEAIKQLPPTSIGELNKQVSAVLDRTSFDTEVFIEIVETIAAILPDLSPRRVADDVLSIIHSEPSERRRSPIIDDWETMPATTRVKVEAMLQQIKPAKSLVRWLNRIADLLDRERPGRSLGAPPSRSRVFTWRVGAIWRRLGLDAGLAYDFHLSGGRVESGFQSYCRAALAALGDPTRVSARQVTNYKRKQGSNL